MDMTQLINFTFFQHALLGSVLACIVCGLVGTYIVTRRLVFISGGITHASFGGIGIGVLFGLNPIISAAVFAVASACGIQWFSQRRNMREDSAIAIFWTLGMSLGIMCCFLTPGFTPELSSFLFGNILTITSTDLSLLLVLAIVAAVMFAWLWRPLMYIAFDAEFARAQGTQVKVIEYVMMAFVALTIVACLRMIGIVLVMSLLTIPQVTANIFTHDFRNMALLAVFFGLAGCLGGLYISIMYNIPSGACIIFFSIMIYLLCKVVRALKPARVARIVVMGVCLIQLAGCSTKKNTSGSRFYHAMTARFNTYFNGEQAYLEGIDQQYKAHKDNYNRLLPMYISADKSTAAQGKSNFETAITKCEKAIKLHSIKSRPRSNSNKKKTEKEKAYLARKEFNPFLKHAWMLMGKAQFQQGLFIEAASTFNYIAGIYATQPEIAQEAKAYLARCYVELDWPYDAEDVFNKMKRDSIDKNGERERNASYAAYLMSTQQYREAIPYLKNTIKKEKNHLQRARLNYLLAQTLLLTENKTEAYKALKRVVRANPPYELAFNAQILQTEAMAKGGQSKTIKRLQRMARNKKNKDYQDRIYYAIGNVHLSRKDTVKCIQAYEEGAKKSTQNGFAKAVLLLKLGELYWEKEQYIEAQRTYAALAPIMEKDHEQHKMVEWRNTVLTEVEPHLSTIKLQDSLQALARMPEAERLKAIDRVIEALKKAEKEEAKKAALAGAGATGTMAGAGSAQTGIMGANRGNNTAQRTNMGGRQQASLWYFYNPQIVEQGKRIFERQWGKRKLENNWRRSNKKDDNMGENEEYDYSDKADSLLQAQNDSIAVADSIAQAEQLADSLANDPHQREYYLRQIPMSDDQMEASNALLRDGLYEAGILEMERIENFPMAERTLLRLLADFKDIENKDNVYYHLFLIYGRLNNPEQADIYKHKLINECPDSKLARLLANPNYQLYAREGKHIEDSLYAATYEAYRADRYNEVFANNKQSQTDFPEGAHRAKFMFVEAMSQLYTGQRDSFLVSLKRVIEKYPQDEIIELAKSIVKGVEEGRMIASDKYDASDIWNQRSIGVEQDSTASGKTLSDDRLTNFAFIIAYPQGTIDEDQLLYEMALYNFTNFMVRNFDMNIETKGGIGMMKIDGFNSFDEAHAYAQTLSADKHMRTTLSGLRTLIISLDNLKLLGTQFSFDDYKKFYDEKFAPLDVPADLRLDEPTEIEIRTPDDEQWGEEEENSTDEDYNEEQEGEGGIIF